MRRTCVLVLSVAVLGVPQLRAADDPKDLFVKAIKAHGGEEALTKYQAAQMKNKGKVNIPGVGETEITQEVSYMLPDKFKEEVELTIAGQKLTISSVVNGDKISITANGNEVPVTDALKDTFKDIGHVMQVARMVPVLKGKDYELAALGEVEVNKKKAVGVRVSKKGQKDVSIYFDKETHLMAKLEFRTTDPMTGNEMTEERLPSDYKKTDEGIPMPRKVSILRDGKVYLEAEVLEVKLLEKLDDADFKK